MKNVTRAIRAATNKSIREFCETELNTQYMAFIGRLRRGRPHPAEIFYISWRTKRNVTELFGQGMESVLTTSQLGGVVDKVREIILKMSEAEKAEMAILLGFNTDPALGTRQYLETPQPQLLPVPTRIPPAQQAPVPSLPPVGPPAAPIAPARTIDQLFINTYIAEEE